MVLVGPYSRPSGGVQVHFAQLEKFLERQGHNCFVINMGKDKTLQSSKLVSAKNALQVAFHLIKKRDHVCHLHFGGTLHARLLLLALFSNLLYYKKCAITVHAGGLPVNGQPKNLMKRLLLRLSFRMCRAVICVNPKIAEFFQQLGLKPERIHIISPFAFENSLPNDPIPEAIGSFIRKKKPLFCNIGLLEPEYELELLIKAFSRFVEKNPEAGLIMIGSGSLHTTLDNTISKLNLRGKVFLTGDLSHSETLKILASSDCYIRVSRYDGDCISLREAINLGIPAIATDTGMRPEEAILVPIGDEEDLLKCMMKATSNISRKGKTSIANDLSSLAKVEKVLSQLN